MESNSDFLIEKDELKKYTGTDEFVSIPENVTYIGNRAFENCKALKGVSITDNVTAIGKEAFWGCTSLNNITISKHVTTIGNRAFDDTAFYKNQNNWENGYLYISNHLIKAKAKYSDNPENYSVKNGTISIAEDAFRCSKLKEITIPGSVTGIGRYAFCCCDFLEHITIPSSVTTIYENAFANCKSLKRVTINNGVKKILSGAFSDCVSLISIDVPESVTALGKKVFDGCLSLEKITIPYGFANHMDFIFGNLVDRFNTIDIDWTFEQELNFIDEVAYNEEKTALVKCLPSKSGVFIVPEGVKTICAFAFNNCHDITRIVLPQSLTFIGSGAFCGCKGLKEVNIPDNIKDIHEFAFQGCISLKDIIIPEKASVIWQNAFQNCTSLTTVKLSNGITSIDYAAFQGCTALSNINIPNSVHEIYGYAFSNCTGLSHIGIPDSVTKLCSHIFDGCSHLVSVRLPDELETIPAAMFKACKCLKEVCFPKHIAKIDEYAFQDCSGLTSIALPSDVEEIGGHAFSGCVKLTDIIFPNKLRKISYSAFENCSSLKNIDIPDSVTDIGTNAFCGCSSLTSLPHFADNIRIDGGAFSKCDNLFEIEYSEALFPFLRSPFGYSNNIKKINISKQVKSTYGKEFINFPKLIEINVDNGNEKYSTINGVLFNKNTTKIIKCPCGKTGEYKIPSSVDEISNYAFYNCEGITDVIIPETVTTIGQYAFDNCSHLNSVLLPEKQRLFLNEGAFEYNVQFKNTSFELFPMRKKIYEEACKKYQVEYTKYQSRKCDKILESHRRCPSQDEMLFLNDRLIGFRIKFNGSHGTQYDELIIAGKHIAVFPQLIPHDIIGFDGSDIADFEGPRYKFTLIIEPDEVD